MLHAHDFRVLFNTVGPSIRGPPRKGQPLNKGHTSGPLSHSSSSVITENDDKMVIPKCLPFGASTLMTLMYSSALCHRTGTGKRKSRLETVAKQPKKKRKTKPDVFDHLTSIIRKQRAQTERFAPNSLSYIPPYMP